MLRAQVSTFLDERFECVPPFFAREVTFIQDLESKFPLCKAARDFLPGDLASALVKEGC